MIDPNAVHATDMHDGSLVGFLSKVGLFHFSGSYFTLKSAAQGQIDALLTDQLMPAWLNCCDAVEV